MGRSYIGELNKFKLTSPSVYFLSGLSDNHVTETLLIIAGWLIALGPLLALGWFSLELLLGLTPIKWQSEASAVPRGADAAAVLLIPAHDEALSIGETVAGLTTQLGPHDRILVVADNCSDDTAAIARTAGAEVVERRNPALRGKGYALAFGRDHLSGHPPAVVIVIDADCVLSSGGINAMANAAISQDRPIQAVDLIAADRALPPLAQISGFAFLIKNLIRLRGLSRLGGCSLLCGTGMAFRWRDFSGAALATGDVVEDLRLAVELIGAGRRPMLIETARVTSPAAAMSASIAQRDRWERGFVGTAMRQAMPALLGGLARADRAGIALGLHLLVPPVALLLVLAFAALLLSAVLAALGGAWSPAMALGGMTLLAIGGIALAWTREGRSHLTAAALIRAPLYVLWKLPIYLRLLGGRAAGWTRTRRAGE